MAFSLEGIWWILMVSPFSDSNHLSPQASRSQRFTKSWPTLKAPDEQPTSLRLWDVCLVIETCSTNLSDRKVGILLTSSNIWKHQSQGDHRSILFSLSWAGASVWQITEMGKTCQQTQTNGKTFHSNSFFPGYVTIYICIYTHYNAGININMYSHDIVAISSTRKHTKARTTHHQGTDQRVVADKVP